MNWIILISVTKEIRILYWNRHIRKKDIHEKFTNFNSNMIQMEILR